MLYTNKLIKLFSYKDSENVMYNSDSRKVIKRKNNAQASLSYTKFISNFPKKLAKATSSILCYKYISHFIDFIVHVNYCNNTLKNTTKQQIMKKVAFSKKTQKNVRKM